MTKPDIRKDSTDNTQPDWKSMYLHMSVALEKAIRLLIKAQQECEDMYIHRDADRT